MCVCVCVHAHLCVCVCVCVYMHMCLCAYVLCILVISPHHVISKLLLQHHVCLSVCCHSPIMMVMCFAMILEKYQDTCVCVCTPLCCVHVEVR